MNNQKSLYPALFKVTKQLKAVHTDATAKIVSKKTGSEFSFKYSSLEQVLEHVKPVLAEHGLFLIQLDALNNGTDVLATYLVHAETGEFIVSNVGIRPENAGAQEYGKYKTYVRRYSILSMLAIATEDDADAHSSSDARRPAMGTPRRSNSSTARSQADAREFPSQDAIHAMAPGETNNKFIVMPFERYKDKRYGQADLRELQRTVKYLIEKAQSEGRQPDDRASEFIQDVRVLEIEETMNAEDDIVNNAFAP